MSPCKQIENPIFDGGPAFPRPAPTASQGMSMRDYFAAAALQGILADSLSFGSVKMYAKDAYKYADAMLAERAKEAQP